MWLFSQNGFVSAVKHKYLPGRLMVRARYEKDIRELAKRLEKHGCKCKCKETKDADYRWRLTCTKKAYKAVMCEMVDELDYTNFKDKVHEEGDKDRDRAYMGVWSDMHGFQMDKYYPKPKIVQGFGVNGLLHEFASDHWNEQDWLNWYHGLPTTPSNTPNTGRVTYLLEDGTEMIWDYDQDGPPENWEDPETGKPFDSSKWVIVEDDTPIVSGTKEELNSILGRGKYHAPTDHWTEYLYGRNVDFTPAPNKRGNVRGAKLLPIEKQPEREETETGKLHELPPESFDLQN